MAQDSHSSRMYVWIRRMFPISHGVAFSIWEDSHSSRTYVWIRRMVLVSHGVDFQHLLGQSFFMCHKQ
jgi:hypothetical protein